ncbi:MAG: hypothetical protein ACRCYU_17960 [Nocardioides sp.]
MSKYEPTRIGERLFDACIGICLGATALYCAAWLLAQVWPWVLGFGVVGALVWWWRRW